MTSTRALQRLIERVEEFLDEYKNDLEADEVSTVDDTITIIDRIKRGVVPTRGKFKGVIINEIK